MTKCCISVIIGLIVVHPQYAHNIKMAVLGSKMPSPTHNTSTLACSRIVSPMGARCAGSCGEAVRGGRKRSATEGSGVYELFRRLQLWIPPSVVFHNMNACPAQPTKPTETVFHFSSSQMNKQGSHPINPVLVDVPLHRRSHYNRPAVVGEQSWVAGLASARVTLGNGEGVICDVGGNEATCETLRAVWEGRMHHVRVHQCVLTVCESLTSPTYLLSFCRKGATG